MYAEFYDLKGLPFQLTPDHRFFFDSRPHGKAAAYLTYGLGQGEGFIVITGEVGAGKTTLVNYMLQQIEAPDLVTAKVVTTQFEAENFLRIVAAAFGLQQEGADKATILTRIQSFLTQAHQAGKRALLFVDEVQNVPHSSLEELRMLSNFQLDDRSLLQIFLIGQPQFRATLASESLEQLRQRVIATYHLQPLDSEETRKYVEHRLHRVEWRGDPTFSDDAFHLIYDFTAGVPRRINMLCDRLLLFGYLEELHRIDGTAVKEVAIDMQSEGMPTLGAAANNAQGMLAPAEATAGGYPLGLDKLAQRLDSVERLIRAQDEKLRRYFDRPPSHDGKLSR